MTQTTLCFYFAIYYIHVGITKKKSLTNALFFCFVKMNVSTNKLILSIDKTFCPEAKIFCPGTWILYL